MGVDLEHPPERYWHCLVRIKGEKDSYVMNDLTFADLQRLVVKPWVARQEFPVAGYIVSDHSDLAGIQIAFTNDPLSILRDQHDARMSAAGVTDLVTRRRELPFSKGEDVTSALLFEPTAGTESREPDLVMVERLCVRLPQAASLLEKRPRKGKPPFVIEDEYDVQDLLQAVLRAYLKHSVVEDPVGKAGGTKSARADVSIEDLGTIIEIKFARRPEDQAKFLTEFAEDLVLYAQCSYLRTFIFLIYNSIDLRDAEALERLSGPHEIAGKKFQVKIILA